MCYTCRFSTAPLVTLTHLSVTSYLHCLFFSLFIPRLFFRNTFCGIRSNCWEYCVIVFVKWHVLRVYLFDSYSNIIRAIHFEELIVLNFKQVSPVSITCFSWYLPVPVSNYQDRLNLMFLCWKVATFIFHGSHYGKTFCSASEINNC